MGKLNVRETVDKYTIVVDGIEATFDLEKFYKSLLLYEYISDVAKRYGFVVGLPDVDDVQSNPESMEAAALTIIEDIYSYADDVRVSEDLYEEISDIVNKAHESRLSGAELMYLYKRLCALYIKVDEQISYIKDETKHNKIQHGYLTAMSVVYSYMFKGNTRIDMDKHMIVVNTSSGDKSSSKYRYELEALVSIIIREHSRSSSVYYEPNSNIIQVMGAIAMDMRKNTCTDIRRFWKPRAFADNFMNKPVIDTEELSLDESAITIEGKEDNKSRYDFGEELTLDV